MWQYNENMLMDGVMDVMNNMNHYCLLHPLQNLMNLIGFLEIIC